jgi:hypothetical protein
VTVNMHQLAFIYATGLGQNSYKQYNKLVEKPTDIQQRNISFVSSFFVSFLPLFYPFHTLPVFSVKIVIMLYLYPTDSTVLKHRVLPFHISTLNTLWHTIHSTL